MCRESLPSSPSSSVRLSLNTSPAQPKCDTSAVPVLGENPKILFRAQAQAFSSKLSIPQIKMKNLLPDAPGKQVFLFFMRYFSLFYVF
jgi:hypothetical protein